MNRYLKITLDDGTRFILRVTHESPRFVRGVEVNVEGDEVVPLGAHQRIRIIDRGRIAKTIEMRMSKKYATLEVATHTEKATPKIVHVVTDTATLAEAMFPIGGLLAFNEGFYEGTQTPIRKMTGREIVTIAGTTAGARVLADEPWISDRFGALGARQIKKLRELTKERER